MRYLRTAGTIGLNGAQIGGLFYPDCRVTNRTAVSHRWQLDGLTYQGLPKLPAGSTPKRRRLPKHRRRAWVRLLKTSTPDYRAQPYQQLAAALQAQGQYADVRATLIAQRHRQRGERSFLGKLGPVLSWLLLGYGYRAWQALGWLALILLVSVRLAQIFRRLSGSDLRRSVADGVR